MDGELAVWWEVRADGTKHLYAYFTSQEARMDQRVYSSPLSSDTAHHVAFVRDGRYVHVYINGTLGRRPSSPAVPLRNISSSGFYVGQAQDTSVGTSGFDPSTGYTGLLSNLKMWNRAFSADEVMLDKNRCLHTIVHLKMDNVGGQELDTAEEVQGGHHAQILGDRQDGPGMCGHHDTAVSLSGNRYDMIRFDDGRFMTGLVEFSVSIWVRPHTFSGTPGLFSVYSSSMRTSSCRCEHRWSHLA